MDNIEYDGKTVDEFFILFHDVCGKPTFLGTHKCTSKKDMQERVNEFSATSIEVSGVLLSLGYKAENNMFILFRGKNDIAISPMISNFRSGDKDIKITSVEDIDSFNVGVDLDGRLEITHIIIGDVKYKMIEK